MEIFLKFFQTLNYVFYYLILFLVERNYCFKKPEYVQNVSRDKCKYI